MLHVPTVAKVKQQRRDDVHVRVHMLLHVQRLYTAYDDMYMTVRVHAVDVCTCSTYM